MEKPLSHNHFKVLDVVAASPKNQRLIATKTGLSLGVVNLILKRLVRTGYIRVKNLDGRRLAYLLTPKGMYEITTRSCHYIQRTLSTYTQLRDLITQLVQELVNKAATHFIVLGENEISDLLCLTLSRYNAKNIKWEVCKSPDPSRPIPEGVVYLDCSYGGEYGHIGISVIEKLLASSNGASSSGISPFFKDQLEKGSDTHAYSGKT